MNMDLYTRMLELQAKVEGQADHTNQLFATDKEFAGKVKGVAKEAIKIDTFTILVKAEEKVIKDAEQVQTHLSPESLQVYADGKRRIVKDYGNAKGASDRRLARAWFRTAARSHATCELQRSRH